MPPTFNYIVTVHNKEDLLEDVLHGVAEAASHEARIIIVLDGCTDGSAKIAERFKASTNRDVLVLETPDVHEIKAINAGLRATKPGYCVILQDDVILREPALEELIHGLCEQSGRRIGFLSLRMATDVKPLSLLRRLKLMVITRRLRYLLPMGDDHQQVATQHEHLDVAKVAYGVFVSRMIGVKSPVCITPELRERAPLLDERFAPYCYDDYDLSIRALKVGLVNGLFPIHFQSDLEWGGTRKDSAFSSSLGADIRLRNQRLFWKKHSAFLKSIGYKVVDADVGVSRQDPVIHGLR